MIVLHRHDFSHDRGKGSRWVPVPRDDSFTMTHNLKEYTYLLLVTSPLNTTKSSINAWVYLCAELARNIYPPRSHTHCTDYRAELLVGFEEKQQCPTNPLSKIIFGICMKKSDTSHLSGCECKCDFQVCDKLYMCSKKEVSSEYFLKRDDGLWHPVRVSTKQLQLVIRPHQWLNCNYYRNFLLFKEHKCLSLFTSLSADDI